jgi:hypothetical protein
VQKARLSESSLLTLFHRLELGLGSQLFCLTRQQGCQMVSFQTKNPNFGKISEGLKLENVDIYYGHLEYFTAIGEIV